MHFTRNFFNLLLDFGDNWRIRVEPNYLKKTVYLDLEYCGQKYFDPETEEEVKLYDHAPKREWRHLDIWDYKSIIRSRVPKSVLMVK